MSTFLTASNGVRAVLRKSKLLLLGILNTFKKWRVLKMFDSRSRTELISSLVMIRKIFILSVIGQLKKDVRLKEQFSLGFHDYFGRAFPVAPSNGILRFLWTFYAYHRLQKLISQKYGCFTQFPGSTMCSIF